MTPLVMVQVDHLVLAVSNIYKYRTGGRAASSSDYKTRVQSLNAVFPHAGPLALPCQSLAFVVLCGLGRCLMSRHLSLSHCGAGRNAL